jgi:GntR family transcriptional regulator, transcriptional repressor for pyruvate dehydrogenase complex
MSAELVEQLRGQIRRGDLVLGDRLPTERALVAELGISRTVVREAVARLSAEGWVEARQGSGVFVKEPPQAFQVTSKELADLQDVLSLLELRIAVETEMAGLAAERRTADDIEEIERCLLAIENAIGDNEGDGVAADAALHAAIARATSNQYFVRFIDFLGNNLVPPRNVAQPVERPSTKVRYLATIQREHHAIVDAIKAGDPKAARSAARRHLQRSLRRGRARAEARSD